MFRRLPPNGCTILWRIGDLASRLPNPLVFQNPTSATHITISCACCTRTVISVLLHPAAVLLSPSVLVFAILEMFILLTVQLLLCMYII